MNLKEFRLFLNKKWDLNTHHQKAIDKRLQPGIFDEPLHPMPLEQAMEAEKPVEIIDEIDLIERRAIDQGRLIKLEVWADVLEAILTTSKTNLS